MLENIDSKFAPTTNSDLEWPTCTDEKRPPHLLVGSPLSQLDLGADEYDRWGKADREHWSRLRTRYLADLSGNSSLSELLERIPDHWTVVSISLAHTKDALFLSRGRGRHAPIIFRIPIGRANRKENSDISGELGFETAKKELCDIIESSARNGKQAQQVATQGKAVRAEWWAERKNLDERLRVLLENIEFCWLGGFKVRYHLVQMTIDEIDVYQAALGRQHLVPPTELAGFYDRIFTIFKKHAFGNGRKGFLPARLEEGVLECFAALPANCKDEELEDIIYYGLDAYQFRDHQSPLSDIAISEVNNLLWSLLGN